MQTPIRKFLWYCLLAMCSCSILEDSDITSTDQLQNIKLNGFQIKQETNNGTFDTRATLVYDSVLDIIDTTGNLDMHITRKIGYNMPALSGLVKLRSGITTECTISVSFTEHGNPYTVTISNNNLVYEVYRFRYSDNSANARLNKIHATIDPDGFNIGNAATINTRDSIFFDGSGRVSSILRNPGSTTFSISYSTSQAERMAQFSISGTTYVEGNNSLTCSESYCQTNFYISGGCSSNVNIDYVKKTSESITSFIQLGDYCSPCNQASDNYYLHPLFFLRDYLDKGGQLTIIYLRDWWIPGPASSSSPNRQEKVYILTQYGL